MLPGIVGNDIQDCLQLASFIVAYPAKHIRIPFSDAQEGIHLHHWRTQKKLYHKDRPPSTKFRTRAARALEA